MGDISMLSWFAIGLAVGIVSKLLYPGRAAGDWVITLIVSIGGALLDGWGSSHLHGHRADDAASWLAALIGAVITVAIYRFVLRRNLML